MSKTISSFNIDVFVNAANHLKNGSLVAFPTETVYGIGADACNSDAVSRIYSVKGRPPNHPLIVHLASMDMLREWAIDVPTYAIILAEDFWPGPMSLVLKRSILARDFVTGRQDTVALRVPNNPIALGLIEAFANVGGKGIAAPSANRFGNVSPTTAEAVAYELGEYLVEGDQILNGGACDIGVESTIIDCTEDFPKILRPGAITEGMILDSTGLTVTGVLEESAIRVSGSLEAHYAPKAKVVLDQSPESGQGYIALADVVSGAGVVRLAAPKNHDEFARVLYSALRAADAKGLTTVVVQQPIGDGIAIAIRDRLSRASRAGKI